MCRRRPSNDSRKVSRPLAVAERLVEVISIERDMISLRPLGACSDCSGCGGRCNLFRPISGDGASDDGVLRLPRALFPRAPRAGQRWRLALADNELLHQSLRGYGAALAGLLLGAASGHAGAIAIGTASDGPTALAALAGTLLMIRLSKRGQVAGFRLLDDAPPA